jgi:hypothetical protein
MVVFRAVCSSEVAPSILSALEGRHGVGRVTHQEATGGTRGWDVITTELQDDVTDGVIEKLAAIPGMRDAEVSLTPSDEAERYQFVDGQPVRADDATEGLGISVRSKIFEALVRVDYEYLMLMVSAAVVATAGMIGDIPIAIIGAMAFSPDLGRLNAMAFASIAKEWSLLRLASGSLAAGLAVSIATAVVATLALSLWGFADPLAAIPDRLVAFVTVLDGVTITIALASGVAAMIVFISDRGHAAVGVGVSITTMPAAAYAGIALADRNWPSATDALIVLVVNIVCVVGASIATGLVLRRRLERRASDLHDRIPSRTT